MRARRTWTAAAAAVLAMSLSGCASLAMLASGSEAAEDSAPYEPLTADQGMESRDAYADWEDDAAEGEGTGWTAWEYTYSEDHHDAAPAFDLDLVNVDAIDDDLQVYVTLSGYDENGWEVSRDLLNTPVSEDGSIAVEGPGTMPGVEQVMLGVDVYGETADSVSWAGLVHRGGAGWGPVETSADEPFTLTLDLASGEATPATMGPDSVSEFWGETESASIWADQHTDGVPVATLTLEGARRNDVMVSGEWWADVTGELSYVSLWAGLSDGHGSVIEITGPAALPPGALADEGTVSILFSAYSTTGSTSGDCWVEVEVTAEGWLPIGATSDTIPSVVLDTETGEFSVDGDPSVACV